MRARTALAALAVAALLPLGCGEDAADEPEPRATPETVLDIQLHPGRSRTITCPGDRDCARLEDTPHKAFDPVPDDVACTQIYGGSETATVSGTLRGRRVEAKFSRQNGCEIARWDRLAWLLGRPSP